MSLDVYLWDVETPKPKRAAIFVREGGQTREATWEEWNRNHPGETPVMIEIEDTPDAEGRVIVFEYNITHNLNVMAEAAGVYKALWCPEEIGIEKAGQISSILYTGLQELQKNPEVYKAYNPKNGWGDYEGLVKFVQEYWQASLEYPNACIEISR